MPFLCRRSTSHLEIIRSASSALFFNCDLRAIGLGNWATSSFFGQFATGRLLNPKREWVLGGVGASAGAGARYLLFLALYDAIFGVLSWAVFDYVVAEV